MVEYAGAVIRFKIAVVKQYGMLESGGLGGNYGDGPQPVVIVGSESLNGGFNGGVHVKLVLVPAK